MPRRRRRAPDVFSPSPAFDFAERAEEAIPEAPLNHVDVEEMVPSDFERDMFPNPSPPRSTPSISESTDLHPAFGSRAPSRFEQVVPSDSEEEDTGRVSHHPNYYFDDGMIVLLVGNRYFKVPRVRLEQNSEVLRKHFQNLGVGSAFSPGYSDEQPVILEDVKAKDFACLLSFLYPLSNRYKTFTDPWSHDTWMSILSLAHKYEMHEIQELAIERLTELNGFKTPIDKICTGEKFDHIAWVKAGYEELITRQGMLTIEEAKIIGLENSIRCARAREDYRDRINSLKYPHYYNQGSPMPSVSASISREILDTHFPHFHHPLSLYSGNIRSLHPLAYLDV